MSEKIIQELQCSEYFTVMTLFHADNVTQIFYFEVPFHSVSLNHALKDMQIFLTTNSVFYFKPHHNLRSAIFVLQLNPVGSANKVSPYLRA